MEDLVARAKAGDKAAVEELLTQLAPAVRRFGNHMCRNEADAQDVLQDTLLAITDQLTAFEGRSSITSWVFALARTFCARRRRGLKNQPPVSDEQLADVGAQDVSPEQAHERRELAQLVQRALDELSSEYREAIALRDVEGLSAEEASAAIGISVPALKSRLHRARESLRLRLQPLLEPNARARPAGCPDVAAMFSRNLEGELRREDCARMEQHLARCSHCEATCHALREVLQACQAERRASPSPAVQAAVRAAIAELR